MRKRRLEHGSLSDRDLPDSEGVINANDFTKAISNFANEHLRGALTVKCSGENEGLLTVSPKLTARMLRETLALVDESDVPILKITVSNTLKVQIIFNTMPRTQELAKIIGRFRHLGFTVTRDDKSITLDAEIKHPGLVKIYAITLEDFSKELYNIFFL